MSDAIARAAAAALQLARDLFRAARDKAGRPETEIEELQGAVTAGDQGKVAAIWNRWRNRWPFGRRRDRGDV